MNHNNLTNGAGYLFDGAQLIFQPKFRLFVVVPILVNVVIFLLLTSLAVTYFNTATGAITGLMPEWDWLAPVVGVLGVVLWVAVALIAVVIYGYSFSMITNIIAAPFYGILAERIETHLTGTAPPPEPIVTMIGRVLIRELIKIWYFVSRGIVIFIGCFFLGFIPLANLFIPVILALWGAWCMAIQYADYAADNNRLSFPRFKHALGASRYSAWGMGGMTLLGTMVPVINIIAMPAAVAGGTIYWVRELRDLP
ncbi:sulfate transporter CysZ [Halioxenophilus aromaticivorans]|uniref:Sulfate transporter CysZ n=1 Tax=Halioxenophilus aromaticivorans TaxID=1306992 RepID=A0AAV3U6R6_9ALTE